MRHVDKRGWRHPEKNAAYVQNTEKSTENACFSVTLVTI